MIRGAIFDLDGVLLDSLAIWWDLGVRYLQKMGITPEEGLSRTLFSMSQEQGAAYLKDHYHLPKTEAEIVNELQKTIETFYFEEVPLKKGAAKLVHSMKEKGIKIEAATSSPRSHVERALERNGILQYFSHIWTNSEVGESKHSPKIYLEAAADMQLAPEEVIVFEDSLYALKTAKSAGFHTAGVYDANGEKDQEGMKKESEIYLAELSDYTY